MKSRELLRTVLRSPGDRLIVEKSGIRRFKDPQTVPAQPETQVHVIEGNRELLIKASGLQKQLPAHHQAGACHSADIVKILKEQGRKKAFPGRRILYVFGIFADKEYEKVIRITAPAADRIFTIQTPGNPRALPAGELTRAIERICHGKDVTTVGEDIPAALSLAEAAAGEEDVIAAFGSLSFLAEVKEYFS